MRNTKIQWADDTANPVMGCDGCELWPTVGQLVAEIARHLSGFVDVPRAQFRRQIKMIADQHSALPHKDLIPITVTEIGELCALAPLQVSFTVEEVKKLLICYAGKVTSIRQGWHPGYPVRFEEPAPFPGRMIKAAGAADLIGMDRAEKPWMNGLPRLIFVSDMGDALSASITFEYLKQEIVDVLTTEKGRRHRWLWLTKRPARLADFSRWLNEQGVEWPANLMGMTSVTSAKTVKRANQLRTVNCGMRGLSVEPLWSEVTLPMEGIDWVIVGGESGKNATPLRLEWIRDIRDQCQKAGVAFFVKQLGRRPTEGGLPIRLGDSHGGDWNEWPADLRVRQMPVCLSRR